MLSSDDLEEIRQAVREVIADLVIAPLAPPPPYLTIAEAAALIRHEHATVRRWIWEGKIKAFKPGKHPLVRREDLLAFVEASETTAKRAARRKRVTVAPGGK